MGADADRVDIRERVLVERAVALAGVVVREVDIPVEDEALADEEVMRLIRLRWLDGAVIRIDRQEDREGDRSKQQRRVAIAQPGQREPNATDSDGRGRRDEGDVDPAEPDVTFAGRDERDSEQDSEHEALR